MRPKNSDKHIRMQTEAVWGKLLSFKVFVLRGITEPHEWQEFGLWHNFWICWGKTWSSWNSSISLHYPKRNPWLTPLHFWQFWSQLSHLRGNKRDCDILSGFSGVHGPQANFQPYETNSGTLLIPNKAVLFPKQKQNVVSIILALFSMCFLIVHQPQKDVRSHHRKQLQSQQKDECHCRLVFSPQSWLYGSAAQNLPWCSAVIYTVGCFFRSGWGRVSATNLFSQEIAWERVVAFGWVLCYWCCVQSGGGIWKTLPFSTLFCQETSMDVTQSIAEWARCKIISCVWFWQLCASSAG